MIGTYVIRHDSGHYYIGHSTNVHQRRRLHTSQLKANTHHAVKLQELFNIDNRLKIEIYPTETKEEALGLERAMLAENKGDPFLTNVHGNIVKAKNPLERKVYVAGKIYPSVTETAKFFGIHPTTVCQRIKSTSLQFSDWQYLI